MICSTRKMSPTEVVTGAAPVYRRVLDELLLTARQYACLV
jgi:hypothetical protein